MRLSRRALLRLAGLAGLGLFVPACGQMFRQMLFSPDAAPAPAPRPAANPFRAGGRSLVAVVRGDDVPAAVRRAMDLIGGIGRLQVRGARTLVKPNVVWGEPPPATTDPRVVKAVASLAREAGAAPLAVGDMSALTSLPTRPHLERTGIAAAAREAGADVLAFEEGEWVLVEPAGVEYATKVFVARAAHEADRLLSVPAIKTHRSAGFSCALKNTVGCVHGRNKPWMYGPQGWEPVVAELNAAVRPHLYVVDGLRAMVRGGPYSGEAAAAGVILASGDPIATDAVALGILKHFGRWQMVDAVPVWEQEQVRRAVALGLGARGPHEVELVSEDLTGGDPAFAKLLESVRRHVGVA